MRRIQIWMIIENAEWEECRNRDKAQLLTFCILSILVYAGILKCQMLQLFPQKRYANALLCLTEMSAVHSIIVTAFSRNAMYMRCSD